jgi:hypothetical protein
MPTASVLTINDGAATPVAHSFTPRGFVGPDLTTLIDLDHNTPAACPSFSLSLSPSTSNRRTNRVKISFAYPKTAVSVVDGAERLVYTARFNADVVIPDDMAVADRWDFAAFIKNAFADPLINDYIKELDPIW